jgi:23S rRNA (uracil1939-C5)-methyltransferase
LKASPDPKTRSRSTPETKGLGEGESRKRFATAAGRSDADRITVNENEEIELTIGPLAYGRSAVARAGGKVLFIEGVAPGDRARVRQVRDHGSYAEAELVELIEAGPARVEPPCPIVSTCGGCCWQHVSYAEQLQAKRTAVIDALQRIGGFEDPPVAPVVPSPNLFGYRNRLRLRFDGGRLGFYRARTHALVPVDDCIIADDRVRGALRAAEQLVAGLDTHATRVEIASRGMLPGVIVAINSSGRLRPADGHRIRAFLERPDHTVQGVLMWGRGWKRQWGDVRRRFEIEAPLTVETLGASFGQVNTEANRLLVQAVLDTTAADARDTVLDLYAGAGNYSLPLAMRCKRVVAVEADADAVAAGGENARHAGLRNVEFHAQRVETFLENGPHVTPDIVVVNPPRDGLGVNAAAIARMRVPRLVYVSCNPTTLARDVKTFAAAGYALHDVKPFDLFPHTFHVEVVCHARLT